MSTDTSMLTISNLFAGYGKVQADLTVMRRARELPSDWLADNTRRQRKPRAFDSVEDALRNTAAFYRKALWNEADSYVEIWLEKDARLPVSSIRSPASRSCTVRLRQSTSSTSRPTSTCR